MILREDTDTVEFNRVWAMPNRHTFTIKPIREELPRWGVGEGWADPFSGWNSPAEFTNDLNPEAPTSHHMDAKDFMETFENESLKGVLFDPPYTPRQVKECYDGFGIKLTAEHTRNTFWSKVKDIAATKIQPGGLAISFGYNTMGFGKNRGFKLLKVLLVPHGGNHNDTLVTVERKGADEISNSTNHNTGETDNDPTDS